MELLPLVVDTYVLVGWRVGERNPHSLCFGNTNQEGHDSHVCDSCLLVFLVQAKSIRTLPVDSYWTIYTCLSRHAWVSCASISNQANRISDTMHSHVSIFNGEWDALVWVPALIWAADRVIRVARVVTFNWRTWNTTGQATFDTASNMVRLQVPLSSNLYRVEPGTFFYLMTLDDSCFWESHPFTVASVSEPEKESNSFGESSPLLEATEPSLSGLEDTSSSDSMKFLIRPYDSFTSRLKDRAEAQWPKPASIRMLVDGPYGRTLPLDLFNHTVFVVGGSGIVVPLSYIRVLLASSPCRRIEIHWAVREAALAEEVMHKDLREALRSDKVRIHVYLTGDSVPTERPEEVGVEWHRQRLNTASTIGRAAALDSADLKSLAVAACGPARMADDARRASVGAMRCVGTRKRIEYFEESFQW